MWEEVKSYALPGSASDMEKPTRPAEDQVTPWKEDLIIHWGKRRKKPRWRKRKQKSPHRQNRNSMGVDWGVGEGGFQEVVSTDEEEMDPTFGLMFSMETGGVAVGDIAAAGEEDVQKGDEEETRSAAAAEAGNRDEHRGRRRCLALSAANRRSIVDSDGRARLQLYRSVRPLHVYAPLRNRDFTRWWFPILSTSLPATAPTLAHRI